MSRILRLDFPDTIYHVYTRGVRKLPLFHDDEDRSEFLASLKRAKNRQPFDILAYSLMTNHYHMELKTLKGKLSETMHYVNLLYACYYNYRYQKSGHVFQSRYHSIVVERGSYLLRLSRYIDLNAPDAGIVKKPEDYRWSSYRAVIGLAEDPLVSPGLVLDTLDPNPDTQRETYRQFVEERLGKKAEFNEKLLLKTRVLGSNGYCDRICAKARALGLIPTFAKRSNDAL
jgi:putative transposase